ncbi:hypothetical protein GOQ27_13460 [Clostridium sp. D2Q-11]|uniref:Uncharacterized protein n=1 Tax=Anaeromonas frigoriresistens TaxID=2683708 RepID=A0A942V3Y0_9FIRM|nr:hypothetical protein [Anaeromonas frigoriresistens]MBS4539477.1 hypothetical protein [Anaeromonas frigoriresistens]
MKEIKIFIFSIVFAVILSFIFRQILDVSIHLNVLVSVSFVFIGSMIGKKLFSKSN